MEEIKQRFAIGLIELQLEVVYGRMFRSKHTEKRERETLALDSLTADLLH